MIRLPIASAHCDIPCKIYDPSVFLIAALSVSRLIDLIEEERIKNTSNSQIQIIRLVIEKETQSKIVKEEVNTIWGDYFKEPQLKKFPETHKIVHLIMQSASKCKQEGSAKNAEELLEHLNYFAEIFWASKGVRTERVTSPYPPAQKVVIPVLFGD
jgi:nickel superoxide dismutase